jgi:hypothetical protein
VQRFPLFRIDRSLLEDSFHEIPIQIATVWIRDCQTDARFDQERMLSLLIFTFLAEKTQSPN